MQTSAKSPIADLGTAPRARQPLSDPLEQPPLRSDGVLSAAEIASCVAQGIELAYDPAQLGWVAADITDDLSFQEQALEAGNRGSRRPVLSFRAWTQDDAGFVARVLSDPSVWTHLPERFSGPLGVEDASALIALANDDPHQQVRAVVADGARVGQARLAFEDPQRAEISYWLDPAVWGRGLARGLVAQFTAAAWAGRPSLQTIVARVHRDNPASARALLRAGYAEASPPDAQGWTLYALDRPVAA